MFTEEQVIANLQSTGKYITEMLPKNFYQSLIEDVPQKKLLDTTSILHPDQQLMSKPFLNAMAKFH